MCGQKHSQVSKRVRKRLPPGSHGLPVERIDKCTMRVQVMSKQESKPSSHEQERTSVFPWDYISLGMGWTRYFFKITNQLPKFLCTLGGFISQPIPSFPRLDGLASLVQYPPPHAILTLWHVCLPSPGTTPSLVGVGKGFFSIQLSCYFLYTQPSTLIFLAFCALNIRTSPC